VSEPIFEQLLKEYELSGRPVHPYSPRWSIDYKLYQLYSMRLIDPKAFVLFNGS